MSARTIGWAGLPVLWLVAGCGDAGSGTGGQTEGSTTSATVATTGDTTTTAGTTSSAGTGTEGATSAPTSSGTAGTSTSSSSQTATSSETTDTSGPGSGGSTDGSTGTSGGVIDTSGSSGGSSGGGSSTGPDCVPAAEVCNDLDDNCNGVVDDVDAGGDGICDCLSIALFGNKGALPSSEFETWLEAQGTQVDRISLDATPITQATLDKYDIIILDWLVRTYSPQEAALIEGWIGSGGGLMSMTGHTNNNTVVDRPNSIIKPMGLSYNSSKGFFSGPVTTWTPHPLTNGITSVSFYGGLYIDIVNDGIGANTVIGTLPQGPVAVAQERKGGKLFIFGDEWIEFDSEWKNIPQIKKFWVNILGWLSPMNFCTIPQ